MRRILNIVMMALNCDDGVDGLLDDELPRV